MKRNFSIIILLLCLVACRKKLGDSINGNTISSNVVLPRPSHIIIVWLENHGYYSIVGNSQAPFINSLIPKGVLFTKDYANYHPSYPNYITWFSGSNQGVVTNSCISGKPFTYTNIWSALKGVGLSFAWYSESLPYTGYTGCSTYPYVEKHNPTTIFKNVPDSINKPLWAFNWQDTSYTNIKKLQRVVCITPNQYHNMHDGTIAAADTWLKNIFSKLVSYCIKHNSIFIVYWDESETASDNRIPVIAIGGPMKVNYKSSDWYDHLSWTRTITSMYGAENGWNSTLRQRTVIQNVYK
jgi:phosphatidylinositol-3-phosphatase